MFDTSQCVHCGLCLTSCPTYQQTGIEGESPRGRIFLLDQIAAHPGLLDEQIYRHLDDCLDCRACEEVCPAHVPTGHLVDEFRASAISQPYRQNRDPIERPLTVFLGNKRGLRWFQRLARWSRSPLVDGVMRRTPKKWMPAEALSLKKGLPRTIGKQLSRDRLPDRLTPANPENATRVMLFTGCIMDSVYADTNVHSADLLVWSGLEVMVPRSQKCCGALNLHAGDKGTALAWARENIKAFEESGASQVVVNAAGCGALLKEYGDLFESDSQWEPRARAFAHAVQDISETLTAFPLPNVPSHGRTVTMHDACHLAHGQGIRSQPRELLQRAGYTLVEMVDPDRCCGSAGIYNLTHPEMAGQLKVRKVSDIPTAVETVSMGNPGCMLQIASGVEESGRPVEVSHTVDLLWQAYQEALLHG